MAKKEVTVLDYKVVFMNYFRLKYGDASCKLVKDAILFHTRDRDALVELSDIVRKNHAFLFISDSVEIYRGLVISDNPNGFGVKATWKKIGEMTAKKTISLIMKK